MEFKDINSENLQKVDAEELWNLHFRMHQQWGSEQAKGAKRPSEELINLHTFIVDELNRRKIQNHGKLIDSLDRNTKILTKEFAPVHPSGAVMGEVIKLEEVAESFKKKIVLKDPFIFLTGGIVNNGETVNDLDMIMRTTFLPPDIEKAIKFRIGRALPSMIASRAIWHYDHFNGPFTSHMPLYKLVLEPIEPAELVRMTKLKVRVIDPEIVSQAEQSLKEDEIKMNRFFVPMKPTKGTIPEAPQTIENFLELFSADDFPVYSSKKYDGAHHIIFKDKDNVKIMSEGGDDNTDRFPQTVAEIQKIPVEQLILDAEVELWIDKKHQPREAVTGYVNSKTDADDSNIVFNIFGVLFYKNNVDVSNNLTIEDVQKGDLHKETETVRQRYLKEIPFSQEVLAVPDVTKKLNRVQSFLSKDKYELKAETEQLSKLEASEGNVAKKSKSVYYLDSNSKEGWVKFHVSTLVHGVILERVPTKVNGTYNYIFGVSVPGIPTKEKETKTYKGVKFLILGKTFSTSQFGNFGEGIIVETETLNLEYDEKSKTFSASCWAPRVMKIGGNGFAQTDTLQEAVARARDSMNPDVLMEKEIKEDGSIVYHQTTEFKKFIQKLKVYRKIEKQTDSFMDIPEEDMKHDYVVQHHFRGKSAHADLRLENKGNKLLIGWTLFDLLPNAITTDVETLQDAEKVMSEDAFKIDWKTGEFKYRKKKGSDKPVYLEVQTTKKSTEPVEWLTFEGVTKPGTVGATRNKPGVFIISDKGQVEYLTQKPYFHEYWLSGGKLKEGRYLLRRLVLGQVSDIEDARDIIPVSMPEEGRSIDEAGWFLVKPLDETPYVISRRAVQQDWMPPLKVSALPKHIRTQIPEEFRYWLQSDSRKAKEMRNNLVEKLKAEEVILKSESIGLSKGEAKFVYQFHWMKGQQVVRSGPSKRFWDLRIDENKSEITHFKLEENILENKSVSALLSKDKNDEMFNYEGLIAPGTLENDSKDTPAFLETVDKGTCIVLEDSDLFKKVQFKGDKLNGLLIFKRESLDSVMWTVEHSELPEVQKEFFYKVRQIDEEKHLVYGVVLEPEVFDAHDDIISKEEIEQAANRFMEEYNKLGEMHRKLAQDVKIVQSYIAPQNLVLNGESIREGSWVIVVHVINEDIWNKIKSKEYKGFSIGGFGRRLKVNES